MEHDVCLNIHYSAPKEIRDKIDEVYRSMEYWCGFESDGCPSWKGKDIDLYASVEPGGIQIGGEMPDEIWNKWYNELKNRLTKKLGYDIGDPEEGYKFKYWTPFEKRYSDIKIVDNNQIVFNDYSAFYWNDFDKRERDISAKRPYFVFKSSLIELFIYFDNTGLVSKKKLRKDFHDFQSKLNDLGISTLDLS